MNFNGKTFLLSQLDAIEFITGIPDNSIDLVATDPPYESIEKHRAIGTTTRLSKSSGSDNAWFQSFPNARYEELFKHIYRVLKENTHFYLFCDQETMFLTKPIAESCGFKFWKPLIWDKVAIGMGYHYRCRYEMILFFEKGKRKLNSNSISDIITCKRIVHGYPAEKPVDVLEVLVKQSTEVGQIVLDPFSGSSSCGVAAIRNKRLFVGNDISDEAISLSNKRLSEII